MKNKKYEVVLFDLDGTVLDSDPMILKTMNILYDKYRDGVRTPKEKVYYFSGPPIRDTLRNEFPHLANIKLMMPDENSRRVGQSIAAASLPKIK